MKQVTGSCNSCGLCCQTLVLPIPHANAWLRVVDCVILPRLVTLPQPFRDFLTTRGVTIQDRALRVPIDAGDPEPVRVGDYSGHRVAYIRSRCSHLGEDNRCQIYETRPAVCQKYPTIWDDLTCVKPACGFDIVEVES